MTTVSRLSAGLLLAAVAVLCLAGNRAAVRPPAAPVMTVSAPYTHDNLTVYVVRGPDAFDAGNVMTLQEALEKGLAVVHETGDVNTLAVENKSDDHELFLQSGDIVKGGRQDRLIASDMLVPPKSGQGGVPGELLRAEPLVRPRAGGGDALRPVHRLRGRQRASRSPTPPASKGEVWKNVEKAQKKLSEKVGKAVNCPTSPTSLQLALENKDLQAKLAGYEKALAGVTGYPDAVGVVVAVNGKVIAADVYGSAGLFKKVWPKLLKAAAADALAQMPKGDVPAAPTVADAERFLASATAGPAAVRDDSVSERNVMANFVQTDNDAIPTLLFSEKRWRADPNPRGAAAGPAASTAGPGRRRRILEPWLGDERQQRPAREPRVRRPGRRQPAAGGPHGWRKLEPARPGVSDHDLGRHRRGRGRRPLAARRVGPPELPEEVVGLAFWANGRREPAGATRGQLLRDAPAGLRRPFAENAFHTARSASRTRPVQDHAVVERQRRQVVEREPVGRGRVVPGQRLELGRVHPGQEHHAHCPPSRVPAGVAGRVKLLQIVDPHARLLVQLPPGGVDQLLVLVHKPARQRPLPGERQVLPPNEQHPRPGLPRGEHHVHGQRRAGIVVAELGGTLRHGEPQVGGPTVREGFGE